MNHYPRHVGDFIRDTVGLSLAERGAYTALLDQYYASERPIPYAERYRLTGAISKADRAAVDYVVHRYFDEGPDGWHQKRADAEIAAFRERSAKATASAMLSVESRKRSTNAKRTISERSTNAQLAISHKPVTTSTKSNAMSSSAENPPNVDVVPLVTNRENSQRREQAKQILGFLNAKTARNFRMCDANIGQIMARMKEGATERELRAVVARKCRDWIGDEKMSPFLRPATLFNRTKFAQYVGEVPPEQEPGNGEMS